MLRVFDEEFAREPWGVLTALRRDSGGVHRVATPDGPPAWLVTRYDDVRAGLLDDGLSTNVTYARGDDYRGFSVPAPLDVFQRSEFDELARLRGAVVGELRRGGGWSERVGEWVGRCLDEVAGATEFDFVERVALPLPALMLGDLLGLTGEVREALAGWADSTMRPGVAPRARDTLTTMAEIIGAVLEQARKGADDTMASRLARSGIGGGAADSGELPGLLFYLLFVWYEVVMDVLAGAVLTLSGRPDQRVVLAATDNPDGAVDELLRFLSPQVLAGPRFAVTDREIGGQRIAAGETVLLCLASANHDPSVFTRPETLDLGRTSNPQLALGHGAHACVGIGFVRPVVGAVLTELYRRLPDLHALGDEREVVWRSGFRHRGPLSLPVRTLAGTGRASSIAPS
ncbi:cytochrome P450 [Nocardia sp. NBC_00511]|uniref:cytochrome P450 n=1 Tax=Nocardia sp. NBC_00511 TaxID=2903591 RepID=UPI0030E17A04